MATSWRRGEEEDKRREEMEGRGRLQKGRRGYFPQERWAGSTVPEMRLSRASSAGYVPVILHFYEYLYDCM